MLTKRKTAVLSLFLLFAFSLSACGSYSFPPQDKAGKRPSTPVALESLPRGIKVIANKSAKIDTSDVNSGFVNVSYTGQQGKILVQISKIETKARTYTYFMPDDGTYVCFPLSEGSGKYKLFVFKNIKDDKYAQVASAKFDAAIKDENKTHLYPNQYVNFNSDSALVSLSEKLAKSCDDDLGVVENIYNYTVENIKYDKALVDNVPTGYLPDLDKVLESKKGICFDYASLMTAMLRCQSIPTKLIVGYAGKAYHAWISVYIEEIGWVNGIIQFDGKDWVRMDPTYAANSNAFDIEDYIGDGNNYHAMFFY